MFGQKLKDLRKKSGYSQEEIGKILSVSKSAVGMWEASQRTPDPQTLKKLAKIYNVDANYFFGFDFPPASPTKVPVLGYVAAGIPIEAITEVMDYEDLSPEMVKDGSEYFGLKIKGDSMEPKISDGDVVIVRKQEDVDSGQIAIVGVNGEEATCKKVMKQEGGILLQPLNPSFAPVFYTVEQIAEIPITILGRVVELRAKF